MSNQLLTSVIVSVTFFLAKFLEMRFILKENKPLKELISDSVIVFVSTTATLMVLEQFNLNEMLGNIKSAPSAFINKPDF